MPTDNEWKRASQEPQKRQPIPIRCHNGNCSHIYSHHRDKGGPCTWLQCGCTEYHGKPTQAQIQTALEWEREFFKK